MFEAGGHKDNAKFRMQNAQLQEVGRGRGRRRTLKPGVKRVERVVP